MERCLFESTRAMLRVETESARALAGIATVHSSVVLLKRPDKIVCGTSP